MAKLSFSKRTRSLIIGISCGLLCAIAVGAYIASVDEQVSAAQNEMLAKYGGDQIDVCVAKNDIAAGTIIKDSDIETKTWIATLLPEKAIVNKSDAIGKKAGSTILAGEVINESRFGFDNADIEIPEGFVALSIPAREVQAVGGAIAAGMKCDVYAISSGAANKIGNALKILATSITTESSTSSSSAWVTLAVSPESVAEFITAAETMEIYLTRPSDSVIETSEIFIENVSVPTVGDQDSIDEEPPEQKPDSTEEKPMTSVPYAQTANQGNLRQSEDTGATAMGTPNSSAATTATRE